MKKRILSILLSIAMVSSLITALPIGVSAAEPVEYKKTPRMMEELSRGLIAVKTTSGVYLSWRVLGKEDLATTAYKIYRNGTNDPIATIAGGQASNYVDKSGAEGSEYKVVLSTATAEQIAEEPWTKAVATKGDATYTYYDVPISKPTDIPHANSTKMSDYNRTSASIGGANDASVGDLDGDGDYEVVLKWDPSNSKDSNSGNTTGHCVFDAYEIINPDPDGKFMWRIDIGNNIAAGAHYSQFMVYDFDNDGKAEIATLTAPGSYSLVKNAEGGYDKIYVTTVGDTEEIRKANNNATTLRKGNNNGPEYYTIFDGATGRPLKTTDAIPLGPEDGSNWGDAKMNRSSRYLAAVAYLDGVNPYYVPIRGMYNRTILRAYTWDGENLTLVKEHNGDKKGSTMYGQGNHNLSVADIDNDGKDEIVYGSACLDDDFKTVLGNTLMGHGDAMHVSDFNNDGKIEVFSVKEDGEGNSRAADFRVAETGKAIWSLTKTSSQDNGRGAMDNIDDAYAAKHPEALALGWDALHDGAYDFNGKQVNPKPNGNSRRFCNFLVYWDDDLGRELLDDNQMGKYHADTGVTDRLFFTVNGKSQGYLPGNSNNGTKQTPSLVADLWGDWREEIIMPADNDTVLRIMTPIKETKYRLTTLMHDSQYRLSVAWQNVSYNQPPHTSYYIGSAALAKDANGNTLNYLAPATPFDKIMYPSDIPDVPPDGIEWSHDGGEVPEKIELERTNTYQIDAGVVPSGIRKKGIRWTSSDPTLATVNSGLIKAVGREGNVTITATSVADSTISKSVTVHVFSTPVESVEIVDPVDAILNLTPGAERTLKAVVTPDNASEKSVEWRSSNPSVATVDADGKVTAVSMGLATIYVKTVDGNLEDAIAINVLPPSVENVESTEFKTDNTDSESKLSGASKAGASFTQTNASVAGSFYKDIEAVSTTDTANLSFRFTTGGTKIDGSNWNWSGHEFTFYVKLLGADGKNILTLSQPFTTSAGTLMSKVGDEDAKKFSDTWAKVIDNMGAVQGSAKRWQVDIEFDYMNKVAKAVLYGFGSGFESDPDAQYAYTFTIPDNLVLEKFVVASSKDGSGGIYWTPKVENFSYEKVVPTANGASSILDRRGEKTGVLWTENDISAATGGFASTDQTNYPLMFDEENQRIWFNPTKPATSYSASKTFEIADNAIVEYDLDWYFGGAVGADREHSEYVQIGDKIRFGWKKDYVVYFSKDAGATWEKSVFTGSNATFTKNIKLTYDKATNTVKNLTFDGTTIMSNEVFDDPMNKVTFGLNRIEGSSTSDWGYPCGLDNMSVVQFVPGAKAQFKATFVNEDGSILKEEYVDAGGYATAPKENPTKAADEYGTYEFIGWDPDPEQTNIVDDTVFTAQYELGKHIYSVEPPQIKIENFIGGKTVTLTCATEDARIYYTLDGTAPTSASTPYTDPIALTETTTVKAIAVKSGMNNSKIASGKISVSTVEALTASHAEGQLDIGTIITLKSATSGAMIYYTTDGSTPTTDSTRYNGSIAITSAVTIKAIAVKDGYKPSDVYEISYTVPTRESDSATVSVGSVTAKAGDTVSVPVYIFADDEIKDYRIKVTYDSSKFEYVSVSPADGVASADLFASVSENTVTVLYSGDAIESGEMCNINLNVLSSATDGEYPITADDVKVTVASSSNLEIKVINGVITLLGSANSNPTVSADAVLTDSEGNSIDSVDEVDGEITANVVVEDIQGIPEDGSPVTVNIILAIYDRNGALVSMSLMEADLSDIDYVFTNTIDIPENVSVGSIKLMIWNGLGDMTPLAAASRLI